MSFYCTKNNTALKKTNFSSLLAGQATSMGGRFTCWPGDQQGRKVCLLVRRPGKGGNGWNENG
jgi:hypothetical protein